MTTPQLNQIQLSVLNHPLIFEKWSIFCLSKMSFLTNYLAESILNEICNSETIAVVPAIKRLRDEIIATNNVHLYNAIASYCAEKCLSLNNLIEIMWIDVDKNHLNIKFKVGKREQLTNNQYENLCKNYSKIIEKVENCLENDNIVGLLNEYSSEKYASSTSQPTNAHALHQILLFNNSKFIYDHLCHFLIEERDKFQDCYNFMTSAHSCNIQNTQTNVASYQLVNSIQFVSQELSSIKTQLQEVNFQMVNLSEKIRNDLQQLKQTVASAVSLFESSVNERFMKVENTIDQQSDKYCSLNKSYKNKYKKLKKKMKQSTISDSQVQNLKESAAENQEKNLSTPTTFKSPLMPFSAIGNVDANTSQQLDQMSVDLENVDQENVSPSPFLSEQSCRSQSRIFLKESRIAKSIVSQSATKKTRGRPRKSSTLANQSMRSSSAAAVEPANKIVVQKLTRSPPFNAMQILTQEQANYVDWQTNLSLITANKWGIYPTINWANLGGLRNWQVHWDNILLKECGEFLSLPPMLLPVELGGWCVQLWLEWNDGLNLCGFLVDNCQLNANPPEAIEVHLEMRLTVKDNVAFHFDELVTLKHERNGEFVVLWNVCFMVKRYWHLPVLTIIVKP